jgi:PAS domain S-box-containing protein
VASNGLIQKLTTLDLSENAVILYSSDSIVDVLGYTPDEVVGKRAWDFFESAQREAAQVRHKRSRDMDKASVLEYCDIQNRDGHYVRCECAFSIVYDVIVACTSIYREDLSTASTCSTTLISITVY